MSPETENQIFRGWSFSVCEFESVINTIENHVIEKEFKFGILGIYLTEMPLETFYEDRFRNLCTRAYKVIHICITACEQNF